MDPEARGIGMMHPCQLGMKCPYNFMGEDGEDICTWPYIHPEGEMTFGEVSDVDCALCDDIDSELGQLIRAYEESDIVEKAVKDEIARQDAEAAAWSEEFRKHREECRKRREEKHD